MEQKQKNLFDCQKSQKNPRLEAVPAEAEGRHAGGLSDDDLGMVSGAGDGRLLNHIYPMELLESNSLVSDQTAVPTIHLPPEERL